MDQRPNRCVRYQPLNGIQSDSSSSIESIVCVHEKDTKIHKWMSGSANQEEKIRICFAHKIYELLRSALFEWPLKRVDKKKTPQLEVIKMENRGICMCTRISRRIMQLER